MTMLPNAQKSPPTTQQKDSSLIRDISTIDLNKTLPPIKPTPPLKKWWEYLNILSMLRLVIGYTYDSSGQKNNMLMGIYLSLLIFTIGIWWGTHPQVHHTIELKHQTPQSITTHSTKKTIPTNIYNRKKTKSRKKNQKNQNILISITAKPPENQPAAYYYSLLALVLLFVFAYYARREAGRTWLLKIIKAGTGAAEGSYDHLKNMATSMISNTTQKVFNRSPDSTISITNQASHPIKPEDNTNSSLPSAKAIED